MNQRRMRVLPRSESRRGLKTSPTFTIYLVWVFQSVSVKNFTHLSVIALEK